MQNIFNKLTELHTPEWLKIVNPIGLVDRLMSCVKFLLPALSTYRAETIRYSRRLQRKGYNILSWTMEDMQDTSSMMIAGGKDAIYNTFPYRVCNVPEYEILGCGYTDHYALKNIDYIYKNGCYWFKEDPTKFCYSYKEDGKIKYYTVAFCAQYDRLPKSFIATSDIERTPVGVQMYDNLLSNGLNGISNAYYLKQRGITTTNGLHGNVVKYWQDNQHIFIITDTGNFISIPASESTEVSLGKPINIKYSKNF